MHTNWQLEMTRLMLLLIKRKFASIYSSMFGERSFSNLFRDSQTLLDLARDKLMTLIYFVIVQCPSAEKTCGSL